MRLLHFIAFWVIALVASPSYAQCRFQVPPKFTVKYYQGECQGGFAHGRGVASVNVALASGGVMALSYEGAFAQGIPTGEMRITSSDQTYSFVGHTNNWELWNGAGERKMPDGNILAIETRNGVSSHKIREQANAKGSTLESFLASAARVAIGAAIEAGNRRAEAKSQPQQQSSPIGGSQAPQTMSNWGSIGGRAPVAPSLPQITYPDLSRQQSSDVERIARQNAEERTRVEKANREAQERFAQEQERQRAAFVVENAKRNEAEAKRIAEFNAAERTRIDKANADEAERFKRLNELEKQHTQSTVTAPIIGSWKPNPSDANITRPQTIVLPTATTGQAPQLGAGPAIKNSEATYPSQVLYSNSQYVNSPPPQYSSSTYAAVPLVKTPPVSLPAVATSSTGTVQGVEIPPTIVPRATPPVIGARTPTPTPVLAPSQSLPVPQQQVAKAPAVGERPAPQVTPTPQVNESSSQIVPPVLGGGVLGSAVGRGTTANSTPMLSAPTPSLFSGTSVTRVQAGLTAAGFAPLPIGPAADLGNAVIYAARGDAKNAAYSTVSVLPLAGDAFAGAVAVGRLSGLSQSAGASLRAEIHHVCTVENCIRIGTGGPWTPKFQELFDKAKISMEDPLNKIEVVGHRGSHTAAYHQIVYRRLYEATEGLDGNAFRSAFMKELESMRIELVTPDSILRKLLVGG